jgi:hypothetical protein
MVIRQRSKRLTVGMRHFSALCAPVQPLHHVLLLHAMLRLPVLHVAASRYGRMILETRQTLAKSQSASVPRRCSLR